MASKRSTSQRVRILTLIGVLVLSGAGFYSAWDALTTGATKAPGRNNNHFVTRALEPELFRSLVKWDLAAGIFFAAIGIASYFFCAPSKDARDRNGDDEL
jgi:hypothetical protein